MKNIPKPTSEFNQLIGEADNLMSLISLEVQCRLNSFNPISEKIETFKRLPKIKEATHTNLKFTNGNSELKRKFKNSLTGKRVILGGYKEDKSAEIFNRYNTIVQKRNAIFHSLPHSIDGKYIKKYRDLSKEMDIIIDEDFLRDFIQQCQELINILSNPDFEPLARELVRAINEHLNIVRSAIPKNNLALDIAPNILDLSKMADLPKRTSEESTSRLHKQ